MTTQVYAYAVHTQSLSPEHRKVINEQAHLGTVYRNRLVEIERVRRDAYRTLRSSLSPDLAALEAAYDVSQEAYHLACRQLSGIPKSERDLAPEVLEVRRLKQAAATIWSKVRAERKRIADLHFRTDDEEFARRKDTAKKSLREAGGLVGPHTARRVNAEVREAMHADPGVSPEWKTKDRAQAKSEEDWIAARSASGCTPGTYLAVDAAAASSFEETRFQPRFVRFAEQPAKVGVQVTKHLPVTDLLRGDSTGLTLRLLPRGEGHQSGRFMRGGVQAAYCEIRLEGRGAGGTRIDVPIVYHRPLPERGTISWVYVVTKRVGLRVFLELQFTVDFDLVRPEPSQEGRVAVNLGWRALDSGDVRVATAYDGTEPCVHLTLPARVREGFALSDRLLKHADAHFAAARAVAVEWFKTADLPAPDVEALRLGSIAQWRSHGLLARLARDLQGRYLGGVDVHALWRSWHSTRIPAKPPGMKWSVWKRSSLPQSEDLFDTWTITAEWLVAQGVSDPHAHLAVYLEWWRRKDAHLLNRARALDLRIMRHRREIYRRWARALANKYRTVVIEAWDKRETAELPAPEDDTRSAQEELASGIRVVAAVSVLTSALEHAFGSDYVIKADAVRITMEHHSCGGESSDPLPAIPVTCTKCKRTYDQDRNAARNLYARSGERPGDVRKAG